MPHSRFKSGKIISIHHCNYDTTFLSHETIKLSFWHLKKYICIMCIHVHISWKATHLFYLKFMLWVSWTRYLQNYFFSLPPPFTLSDLSLRTKSIPDLCLGANEQAIIAKRRGIRIHGARARAGVRVEGILEVFQK